MATTADYAFRSRPLSAHPTYLRAALVLILLATLLPIPMSVPPASIPWMMAPAPEPASVSGAIPATSIQTQGLSTGAIASAADLRRLPSAVLGLSEQVAERSAHSATFRHPDGSFTSVVSPEPLHYQDARGQWQIADPAFRATGAGFEVRQNAVRSRSGAAVAVLEVAAGNAGLTWRAAELGSVTDGQFRTLASALAAAREVWQSNDGRVLRYEGAWSEPALTEEIASAPAFVEHSLVLAEPPAGPPGAETLELRATLTLLPGATLWAGGLQQTGPFSTAGALSIRDRSGVETLRLEPVVAYEQAAPEVAVGGEYVLEPGGEPGVWRVSVRTPWQWWTAPDRRYPAVIDPQMRVLTSTGYSSGLAWVNDFTPFDFNFNPTPGYFRFNNRMILGSAGSAAQSNGYVQFNTMPFMPTNNPVQVSAATLEIVPSYQHTPYYELDDGPDYEKLKLQFYAAAWPVSSCLDPAADPNCFSLSDDRLANPAFNWNNRPAPPANPDTKMLSVESEISGGKGLPTQWDVTAAVQAWYDTSHPRPAHGPIFGLARTAEACTVWHSQMESGAAITVPNQVLRCTRLQVTPGNARLLVDYHAIVLPDEGTNLLNRPGVPSYAEDATREELLQDTNHQYQVKTGSGKWVGVAARGNHAAGAPADVPVHTALKLIDPPQGVIGDGDEGTDVTSWVAVDGLNPNAANRTLTASVIRDERNNFDADARRNYRIQYASGRLWTPTDGKPNPPPPGAPDGAWRTMTYFLDSDALIDLVEFDLGPKYSGGVIITPTKMIEGLPAGPALGAVTATLLEPTAGGLASAVRTPNYQGSDGALSGFSADATSRALEFGGQNTQGRYALALVNDEQPFLDGTRTGRYRIDISILACPDGTIPTVRLGCQPIVIPHSPLAAPYNFPTHHRTVHGVRVNSEGGFADNGASWCTTAEQLGAPLLGPLGVIGTERYVYVAQGSVCYDAPTDTLFTTDDSAVGLAYAQSYAQPDGTTRGQRAPSVPLYGSTMRSPADPTATGRVQCIGTCDVLTPAATTERRILPFARWGASYTTAADAIATKGLSAGSAFGSGSLKARVSVDVQSAPFDRSWDVSWELYPSPGAPDPNPAAPSEFRRYFFNVGLDQDAPLPSVMDLASVSLRLLDGPDGASTGAVKEHHSTLQSAGPILRELSAPFAKLTLPDELGGAQPGATKKAQAVILPPGQARRTPADDPDPVTTYCGDTALSCLELRRPEYAWDNGNGVVLRVDLPDMFIREKPGTVMVSEAGKLTVFSSDHPDAGMLSTAAFSQEFQFETWGASVQLSEEACEPGSAAIVTVIRGTAAIALPMLGSDGSNGGPVAPPSVVMNFRLCRTELQYARLELDIAPGYLPVGATGMGVDLLAGEVTIGQNHTTIILDVGFRSVPSDAVLSNGFGRVTIDTRGLFQVQAQATIVGVVDADLNLAVAWNPLDVLLEAQASAFGLVYGSLKLHAWVGQGWQNKYSWLPDNNDFHFTGSIKGFVRLKEDLILPYVPPDDIDIGVKIAFGEFCTSAACSQYAWGMSAAFVVAGVEVGLYVDEDGPELILGSDDHTLIDEFGGGAQQASAAAVAPDATAPAAPPPSNLVQIEQPGQFQPWLGQSPEPPTSAWPVYGPGENPDGACDVASLPNTVTCTFDIAADAAGRAAFSAAWLNGDLTVTVLRPDGSEITGAEAGVTFTQDPGPVVKRTTFLVKPASGSGALPAGTWRLRISGAYLPAGGASGERHNYSLMFATDPPPPALTWITPAVAEDGTNSIHLSWSADRAGGAVPERLELFYTPLAFKPVEDTEVISATLIANGIAASQGGYAWDTSGLASGEYAVAARIDDHLQGNGHVVSWAPGSVVIADVQAPPEPELLGAQSLSDALVVLWKRDLVTRDLAGYLVEYTYPTWDNLDLTRQKLVLPRAGSPWWNSPLLPEQARLGGLLEGYTSEICVRAFDASGNVSSCTPLKKQVDGADERPPRAPRNPSAEMERSPARLRVTWSGPDASRPAGYLLGYEPVGCLLPGANQPAAEGPSSIDVGNTFAAYLSGLAQGQRYRLTIASYDALGTVGSSASTVAMFLDPADLDGDGLPDAWANVFQVSGSSIDADGDGLTNGGELVQGTYPTKADSDRDGFDDGVELAAGSDPCGPDRPAGPAPATMRLTGPAVARFTTPANLATVTPARYWVINTGAGSLQWQATASEPWITTAIGAAEPGGAPGPGAAQTTGDEELPLEVGINVCGLAAGRYRGTVTVTNLSTGPGQPVETAAIDVEVRVLGEKILTPGALGVSRSGDTVNLAWADVGADNYRVWRDDADPYFGPGGSCTAPGCVTVGTPGYSESLPVGTLARYYFVQGASLCGSLSEPSGRVGVFGFSLAPGAAP